MEYEYLQDQAAARIAKYDITEEHPTELWDRNNSQMLGRKT